MSDLPVALSGLLFAAQVAFLVRGGVPDRRWMRALNVLVALSIADLVLVAVIPGNAGFGRRINVAPIVDSIRGLAEASDPLVFTVDLFNNLLLAVPAAYFIAVRYRFCARGPRMLAAAASGAFLVEAVQFAVGAGQVSSIDDMLLTVAGAMLGWVGAVVTGGLLGSQQAALQSPRLELGSGAGQSLPGGTQHAH